MKFIVKYHPEITIKSRPVRKLMVKNLKRNLVRLASRIDKKVYVYSHWDFIEIVASDEASDEQKAQLADMLVNTPGITQVLQVQQYALADENPLDDVYQKTHAIWAEQLAGKTFCVRVKRSGKHEFTSSEAERYIGGGLNQHSEAAGVKLKQPDITVNVEIKQDRVFIVEKKLQGLGGYPMGTQESTITLISGGFDSCVAAYLMMKRGIRTHFLFFNLGGRNHEIGVKEVSRYLWDKFQSSHDVKFVNVPFEGVVTEILTKVDNTHMGVVLKRMMLRAAEQVANNLNLDSVVTGEAIAQVSSQTLTNLKVIDDVTEKLVLRPLIVSDKQEIVDTAKRIGTYEFAASMPEYCGVISDKPTTCAKKAKVLAVEANFDMSVLDQAVENAEIKNVSEVGMESLDDLPDVAEIKGEANVAEQAIVIDIRHPDEAEKQPLNLESHEVQNLPFFSLRSKFGDLDQSKQYLLYCDRGVMSKLQAIYLKEDGFENVEVFKKD